MTVNDVTQILASNMGFTIRFQVYMKTWTTISLIFKMMWGDSNEMLECEASRSNISFGHRASGSSWLRSKTIRQWWLAAPTDLWCRIRLCPPQHMGSAYIYELCRRTHEAFTTMEIRMGTRMEVVVVHQVMIRARKVWSTRWNATYRLPSGRNTEMLVSKQVAQQTSRPPILPTWSCRLGCIMRGASSTCHEGSQDSGESWNVTSPSGQLVEYSETVWPSHKKSSWSQSLPWFLTFKDRRKGKKH